MNKKKWTSLFLAFVMVLGILPLNVFAEETGKVDGMTLKITQPDAGTQEISNGSTILVGVKATKGGNSVSNENITISFDGKSITSTTDNSGQTLARFEINFTKDENKKDVEITANAVGASEVKQSIQLLRVYKIDRRNAKQTGGFNPSLKDALITVEANNKDKFDHWKVPKSVSDQFKNDEDALKKSPLKFKMPAEDIIIEAIDKDTTTPEPEKDEYTLYLNSRSSIKSVTGAKDTNSQKVKVGEKITIKAHRYYKDNDDNGEFDHWSVKGLSNYDDDSTREITFKMPKKDVTIEPIYDGENDDDDDDSKDIEIKRIEIYRNALVVQVNKKDARVYLKKKNSSYDDKKADEKESSNKYNAVFWENFYDKSDRENFKVYAKKGSDKTSEIKLDGSSSKIYRYDKDYDKDNKNDLKRIYPSNIELFDKSGSKYRKVKGKEKDYPNEKIYVYYDGSEYGNAKSDSDGYFEIKLDESLKSSDKSDLKFYVKDDSKKDTKAPIITRGITGELKLEGKGVANGATVEVKDSNGTKLGSTTADRDGKFTVSLNRALKGGEMLEVIAKESGKSDAITKFLVVGGVVGGPSVSNGYINGYPDGTFKPNNNMTRGEAAMMMARLINGSENFGTSKLTNFSDANYQWYSEAINFVVAKGLINGYPNGTFNPNGKITRAEFTQMISKYLTSTGTKQVNFNDVSGHWAQPAINKVASKGIIDGYSDGSFKPNKEITRAEASKILNGTFGITSTGSYTKYFTDVKKSDWFYNDVMNAANYK